MKTNSRYEHAYDRALQRAAAIGQADFCETLDVCLAIAIESDGGITESRAIEMLDRFAFFCNAVAVIHRISGLIRALVIEK